MVETNPAAILLDVNKGGKNVAMGSKGNGDSNAFSREFEQVSRSSVKPHDAQSAAANEAAGVESEAQDAADLPQQDETRAAETEIEEQMIATGGKDLPPVADVADEDIPAGTEDTVSSLAQVETIKEVVQAAVQQEVKQASAQPVEQSRQNLLRPVDVNNESRTGRPVDDTSVLSSLRSRDLNLANMSASSKESGNQAATQQGKADTMLFTMVNNGNRSAIGFGEILGASTAGMMPSNNRATQSSSITPAQMSITVPLQQHGWDQAMGERVVWMARSHIQHAQIQLNPRELGPIEIKISLQNDQTHVNFVAHHATTRDAIEAALPRLREMLGEQGLNLGQADVSQHSFGDGRQHNAIADTERGFTDTTQGLAEDEATEDEVNLHSAWVSDSAVDYFA